MKFLDIKPKYRIGMRTIKTSLAVTISLYLSLLLNLHTPIFTAIAAITSMKASLTESFEDVKKRMFSSVFGVVLGYAFSLIPVPEILTPLLGGLGIIIIIYILQHMNMKSMVILSCIVFVASFTSESSKIIYGVNRVVGTFLGIAVSVVINYLIATPDIFEIFINNSRLTLNSAKKFLMELVIKDAHSIDYYSKAYEKLNLSYELLMSEKNIPIHGNIMPITSEKIMNHFRDINVRFQLLNSIEDRPDINCDNKKALEDMLHINILDKGKLKGELNTVYNFQIDKILLSINELERILGEYDYE
ncbi:FUSC family protein [Peptoniphilus catoniae]|uniref:FUSC family protein n=1 Tax=Peptoniphilus catoniae TaxID=1660341 RepID=UPI0010FDBC61|nr:aromatic acid exporter family protein [Peptoniphilus catoniae]